MIAAHGWPHGTLRAAHAALHGTGLHVAVGACEVGG